MQRKDMAGVGGVNVKMPIDKLRTLEEIASSKGLPLASYVRMVLYQVIERGGNDE
jgi:predicted DNA binding CopG/RHH family protein